MKEVKRIKIDENLSNELQTIHYEINARKSVIAYMVEAKINNSEGFKQYHKDFNALNVEYEKLKSIVAQKYLPDEYKEKNFIWQMDFDACEFVILEV